MALLPQPAAAGCPFTGALQRERSARPAAARWLTGWLLLAATLLLGLLGSPLAWAQDVLAVPKLTARVMDSTGTLSNAQVQALDAKLAAFEQQAGPQIVVLVLAATAPEDITSYAQRVADTWKIGRRTVGDGVLVVVAKDERKVRIEVAKALEGAIPDLAARQIIDSAIRPAFRANDYASGLNAAVDQLMGRIKGEGLPAPQARTGGSGADNDTGLGLEELAIFFFVAVPILGAVLTGLFGRRFGSLLTASAAGGLGWVFTTSALVAVGAGVVALFVVGILGIGSALRRSSAGRGRSLPHIGGWGGGGGFGGGGGGFSSGGGGDFGGGGASGDW